ncbi:hypothetical protein NE237_004486 [Protea cynaroides]|uniref:Uncharacterized protein n=1 Tax=Protea cynaroides TaxID=273540 RepID=A0A9Q0KIZ0_9MAGN|nr:hypothetical protein NE237_004486 [Protea cynaroides]
MATSEASKPLQDRVAIITGASRGMGRDIALHIASLGAKLVLNYTSSSSYSLASLLAAEINNPISDSSSNPVRAVCFRADVSDPAQVAALFDHAEQIFQTQPHILINAAGVLDSKYPTVAKTAVEDFDATFNINTKGTFLCCREAANRLVRGGGGRIICFSSSMVGGLKPGFAIYAASKAANETMIKILAKELKGTGITANCVAPGPVTTEMFYEGKKEEDIKKLIDECPLGRLGETKDISPIVGFLAGDSSEWINGQVIRANGGYV